MTSYEDSVNMVVVERLSTSAKLIVGWAWCNIAVLCKKVLLTASEKYCEESRKSIADIVRKSIVSFDRNVLRVETEKYCEL